MAFPCETYLEFVTGYVVEEFRHLYAQLREFLGKEHNGDGTHGAITATSLIVTGNLAVGGTQPGGLEATHGNVVVGDQPPAGAAIGGYGIKIGRWRIIEDRTGAARDLLFQNPDLLNVEHLFKFAAQGGTDWALQPGLGAGLLVGTINLPLVSLAARRVYVGQFGAFLESGTGDPNGAHAAPPWARSPRGVNHRVRRSASRARPQR